MSRLRRTKIVATLGPATDKPGVLEKMLRAGVDLVRLNFSHGIVSDHQQRMQNVRECAVKLKREVGVMADLQGPKIRVAQFKQKKIQLIIGAEFVLDAALPDNEGDEHQVGITYKGLPNDVFVADNLLLDDGRIVLKVKSIQGQRIICDVVVGGELSNNKGINRQGGGLSAAALTDKDRNDLKAAVAMGADYIAISFPREAGDILEARALLEAVGSKAGIIAKIERAEALTHLEEIIQAADAVMVARGDLGVEIGDAELPAAQKRIIHDARSLNKAVITATQMMESMIHNTIPTRAEVFDVANAVLDGTDAVMLSAETASGEHPDKVVEAMARICLSAEKQPRALISKHRVETRFHRVDEAIAMASMYTANHLHIKAIIALTESGSTPLWMSRIRSGIPIYGLTRNIATQRFMTLYRGVYPLHFDVTKMSGDEVDRQAVTELQRHGIVKPDDLVIISRGDVLGIHGGTNTMKIVRVGDMS